MTPRFLATLLLCASTAAAAVPDYAKEVRPALETYCFKCHANGKKKGHVSFDGVKTTAADADHKFWDSVLENVKTGEPVRRVMIGGSGNIMRGTGILSMNNPRKGR